MSWWLVNDRISVPLRKGGLGRTDKVLCPKTLSDTPCYRWENGSSVEATVEESPAGAHCISQKSVVRRLIPPAIFTDSWKWEGKGENEKGENVMGLLSYKIIRSTCLGFSKQLQVIVTCDVLQQRLTTAAMGRSVLLEGVKQELSDWYMNLLRDLHIWSMWHPPCTCLFVEQSFSSSSSLSPSPYIAAVSLPGPGGKR